MNPDQTFISQLFDAQPDSVVWFSPVFGNGEQSAPTDFEARYCNQKAAQFLNTTPAGVIGARLLDTALLDEASRRHILDQCVAVWTSNEPVEFTYHSPGHNRYYNVQRSKVQGGILSITRDRTAEKQAEQAHAQQEERYRQILDTAADGILVLEAVRAGESVSDFRVTHANRRAYEIGALPQDAVGRTLLQLFPHLENSEQLAWHLDVVETGLPFQFETSFRQPDGSEYGWFIVSLTRLGDGLVSNFVDVTQRKRNESEIEEQKRFLQNIFNSSVNGMLVCSAIRDNNQLVTDMRIDLINPAFTQILGYTEEQALGKLYLDLFPASRTNGVFEFNRSVLEQKTTVRKEIYYRGEGIDAWFDVITTAFDGDGLMITFTEITERKRLEIELGQKLSELKRSNQSLEEFAYAASHDLQEPLRKIHFFSDRLRQSIDPESEQGDMFARMESATTRMRDLIEDLLAYSRLSVVPEVFTEVALGEVVNQVLTDLERSVEESGATVNVDALPTVEGDERQMRQLFQNLLSNALKYRMEGRPPEVSVRYRISTDADQTQFDLPGPAGSFFLIEVADNGIGFEQQYAEKIFQVFQRLHGRSEYSGSGVGLAIARKVVLNHNGLLHAEGRPGEGATFRIFLPVSILPGRRVKELER